MGSYIKTDCESGNVCANPKLKTMQWVHTKAYSTSKYIPTDHGIVFNIVSDHILNQNDVYK